MARELPPTQSQMSVAWMDSQMESQPIEKIVWGRIYGKNVPISSIDLNVEEFTVGRGENNSLELTLKELPEKILTRISKKHFLIRRENCDLKSPVYIKDCSRNGTFLNGELIGANQMRIMKDNDVISLAHHLYKAFQFKDLSPTQISDLPKEITDKYHIDKKLGSGACGIVNLVYNRHTCQKFAIKTVQKYRLSSTTGTQQPVSKIEARVLNEAEIMKRLTHPCVITMFDIINTKDNLYMVLEYMKGGDLLSRIISKQRLSEEVSKFYFYQMCLAIEYLHKKDITHRDLKPDNVLLFDDNEETLIKVSDFGLSKLMQNESVMHTLCGTPMYVAPEVLSTSGHGFYNKKVDVWGLGILLFTSISGTLPFSDQYGTPVAQQILHGRYQFRHECWKRISRGAKNLVKTLLVVDPKKRPSIGEVLRNAWLRDAKMIRKANELLQIGNGGSPQEKMEVDEDNLFLQPPKKRARHASRR